MKSDFLQSDLIQSAVLQKLAIIGEASARVSDELRNTHADFRFVFTFFSFTVFCDDANLSRQPKQIRIAVNH